MKKYEDFKDFKSRILTSTNLFGRGIDIERVNIVINYDIPESTDTYLHRVLNFIKIKLIRLLVLVDLEQKVLQFHLFLILMMLKL